MKHKTGFLTVSEVATKLGVSRTTVYRWVHEELIESCRFGRRWSKDQGTRGGAIRIPVSEVETRLAA